MALEDGHLERLWSQLTKEDPAVGLTALETMFAAPEQAVPFLAERLCPPGDAKRIAPLVKELESSDFETRQRATADLRRFGEAALPALEKALAGEPSLDAKRRIEGIIERVKSSEEALRCWRSIDLLEKLGAPAARDALKGISQGGPVKGAAQAAREALQRLDTPTRP